MLHFDRGKQTLEVLSELLSILQDEIQRVKGLSEPEPLRHGDIIMDKDGQRMLVVKTPAGDYIAYTEGVNVKGEVVRLGPEDLAKLAKEETLVVVGNSFDMASDLMVE